MYLYYDIHTHKIEEETDTFSIVNRMIRSVPENKGETSEYISAGIHPRYIEDVTNQLHHLEEIAYLPNVKAIGEAGIDKLTITSPDMQKKVFIAQAELAGKTGKPLIIHCVKAWDEIIAVKKQLKPDVAWIIHGFRGKPRLAQQLIHTGFYLSFGEKFNPEALSVAWPDRLLIETDESDKSIHTIYQGIASALSLSITELQQQIRKNVQQTFSI